MVCDAAKLLASRKERIAYCVRHGCQSRSVADDLPTVVPYSFCMALLGSAVILA